ncbi:MAG TPA: cytochrome c biogenesis protein, partial [Acidobacteriota bacterium]|jgi:heme exporter protein C|nr:cytochrome c biogenesis protein [Acidobacteriota bacterium]
MLLALYCALIFAPTEAVMGEVQRIFYFHFAVDWISLLAPFVVFVFSIAYLAKGDRKYDVWASSSAEIAVLFGTLVMITGSLWAKPVWNTWWAWGDPRLTTFLVLWLIYVAYLILRANMAEGDKKYRVAAVFGIIGFVDVPIVWMSIRWWRTIHPVVITANKINLDPDMQKAMFVALGAFTLLYFVLMDLRVRQKRLDYEISVRWINR